MNYTAHPSAIIDNGTCIGKGTHIWHFCHIMANSVIGENCNIGQNVYVDTYVHIGNYCKIQNNVSIYRHVTLEDDVFCGPSMVFTNVYMPRARIKKIDQALPTLVGRGATIGANATIICGVTIGKYAFIGAGSVVTRNVPDYALVFGNPARQRGWVCICGEKLSANLLCPICKLAYELTNSGLARLS